MNRLQVRLHLHHEFDGTRPPTTADVAEGPHLITEILVDDVPLMDFGYYAADLHELIASAKAGGAYFIITCWCGIPQCAGIYEGIEVQHIPGQIRWEVPGRRSKREPRTTRVFVFEPAAYEAAIREGIKQGKRLRAWRKHEGQQDQSVTPSQNEDLFSF